MYLPLSLTSKNSEFLTKYVQAFHMIPKHKVIISLSSINWLLFIMQMKFFLCEGGIEFVHMI